VTGAALGKAEAAAGVLVLVRLLDVRSFRLPGIAIATALLAAVTAVPEGPASPAEPAGAVESLVATERAFAAASEARGMRAAFLEYLGEGAIVFRPGPVDGRAWFEARPEIPGTLSWRPALAAVAGSGDLGYTSGPWQFRPPEGQGSPQQGHFVSVWRRAEDGAWKVALDLGVVHPATPAAERVEVIAAPEGAGEGARGRARAALLEADGALGREASRKGVAGALSAVAADDVRIYRNGSPPGLGKPAIERLVPAEKVTGSPTGGDASSAGDLGYTYGIAMRQQGEERVPAFAYARIWRLTPGGAWRVVLDVASPFEGE
jgi:ketosteroid isomerase-like protein